MEHIAHLSKDKKLAKVIASQQPVTLRKRKPVYLNLIGSIMSQQLSTKVAAVIQRRFLDLFDSDTPSCEDILAQPFDSLRGIGLSNAKAQYVQHVCRFFIEEKITDRDLHRMDDETLISYLTQIKGVGRWTTEMILMFTMAREDVMALDDLGIQQGMARLYKLDLADKKKLRNDMIRLSDRWRPYRTYACRYIWGWKDEKESKKTAKDKS